MTTGSQHEREIGPVGAGLRDLAHGRHVRGDQQGIARAEREHLRPHRDLFGPLENETDERLGDRVDEPAGRGRTDGRQSGDRRLRQPGRIGMRLHVAANSIEQRIGHGPSLSD